MTDRPEAVRLDTWLWAARFFKTRALAAQAVEGGRVQLHGHPVKRGRQVHVGDRIRLRTGPYEYLLTVRGLATRRGPAAEAAALYVEDPESRTRREHLAEQQRLARQAFAFGEGKPTKRDRRALHRLKGRD
jgi:ribosome-associated heat shock protein Hsp15